MGKKAMRVISFDAKLRAKLEDLREEKKGVALVNCSIKETRESKGAGGGGELEIVASSRTTVEESAKVFSITSVAGGSDGLGGDGNSKIVSVEEVGDVAVNQHVTITGKVNDVEAIVKVHSKNYDQPLRKQDFSFGDCTGICRGVVWEKDVGCVEVGGSYRLEDVTVRSFNGVKYVSVSEKSRIVKVDDVGEVVDEDVAEGSGGMLVVKGEVTGVSPVDEYRSCMNCKGSKVVELSELVGECRKCGMQIKLRKCAKCMVVQLVIEDEKGEKHRVTAFGEMIERIVRGQPGDTVEEQMFCAPVMLFTITQSNVVANVAEC